MTLKSRFSHYWFENPMAKIFNSAGLNLKKKLNQSLFFENCPVSFDGQVLEECEYNFELSRKTFVTSHDHVLHLSLLHVKRRKTERAEVFN